MAGHYLLTEMLIEKMIGTAEQTGIQGRIINLSSVIHSWVGRDCFHFNQMLHPIKYFNLTTSKHLSIATFI